MCDIIALQIEKLNGDAWKELKNEFAPYAEYLARAQGDLAGQLGREKLEKHLAGDGFNNLRKLFAADKTIGGVVDGLRKLERLLLYSRYLLEFVNNFVSFYSFFDNNQTSMLQAGRLIMDGKSYNLAVWIDDIAAHKKVAVRSNMCLLYLDVVSSGAVPVKRKVAVAVTGGSLTRIYVGKPAFFIDNENIIFFFFHDCSTTCFSHGTCGHLCACCTSEEHHRFLLKVLLDVERYCFPCILISSK